MEEIFDDNKTKKLLKQIDEDLKKEISEKRYKHSMGVMKKAEELAKIYGEDVNKAKLIGLAHDIGKELSKEEKLQYAIENKLGVDEIEKVNIGLLHAKIGADICKKRYGFTEDMQARAKALGYSVHEILTIASIIEKEAFTAEQRTLIASTLYNRLDKGMKLQCDVTVKYCTGVIETQYPDKIDHYKY